MLTDAEYDQALRAGKARPARASCPLCHGKGIVVDPDRKWAPEPCWCGTSAAEAERRLHAREAYRAVW